MKLKLKLELQGQQGTLHPSTVVSDRRKMYRRKMFRVTVMMTINNFMTNQLNATYRAKGTHVNCLVEGGGGVCTLAVHTFIISFIKDDFKKFFFLFFLHLS